MTPSCFKCATPLPDGARFCSACGTDVSGEHTHEKTLAVDHDAELMSKLQQDIGGEYVIERELGRGGMAIVYLGHDAQLGRKVAVKLLPPELAFGSSGSIVERFRREARTSATLDHSNIIPVYRVSQGGKFFWYVMKYLDGEALDRVLERTGQQEIERTVEIVRQVADALDYAHQHQVIHRDIKPANVIVDAKGRCTVTDFGISKALDANTLTATGSMIGTPYYMSPEQCSGKKIDGRSDQYALAVMTYQMLGGHVPFTGDSVVDIIRKHVMDPVPPLKNFRPQLPDALVTVVERGLAKDAADRFPTCTDFAKALDRAAQGLDVSVAPPAGPERKGPRMSKTALVSPVPGVLRTAKGAARRRPAIIGVVAAVLLAAGGLSAWLVVSNRDVAVAPAPAPAPPAAAAPAPQDNAPSDTAARPASAADAVQPAAPTTARITLRGVPAGAAVFVGVRRMTRAAFALEPGRHIVKVTTTAGQIWSDTVDVRAGVRRTLTVRLPAATSAAVNPAAPDNQKAPAPSAPPAAGTARISIGSRPNSAMTINGRPAPSNPVTGFEVPSGTVRVRFQVTDSIGPWSVDTSFVLAPGETRNVGRVQLRRSS